MTITSFLVAMLTALSGDPQPILAIAVLTVGGVSGIVLLVRFVVSTAVKLHVSKDTQRSKNYAMLDAAERKRK